MNKTFTCYKCNQTFPKRDDEEWSDAKALEEMITLYPETKDHVDIGVLCDDCNEEFKAWFCRLTDEEKQKMRDEYDNT
jgi:hypothetical protein